MKVGVKWVIALGAVALGLGLLATCRRGDFTLPPPLTPMVIPQGTTATKIITITRTDNFRGEVSFSIADAPPGLTARFSPETITSPGTQTTLTLTIGNQVPVGSYKIRIVAKSGNKTRETALEVRVEVGPDFSMATTPTRLTVKQGASGKTTVTFSRNATFNGPITLTLEGAPAGVIGTFSPASVTGSASTLNLAVAMPVAPGEYTLTIRGKGDGVEKLVPLSLVVEPSFGRLTVAFPTELLGILHDWEKVEQIRDWIVCAFLVAREVPPEVIAVALHNQPPFRQPVLSEVHTWQYGIGRWVWVDDDPMDTEPGDLYTFLPEGADHRLVGGLADDFRRATGTIPTFVHLVRYKLDETARTATFELTTTWPGKELFTVGGPFGYRERVIRSREDLDQFLKETDDLVYATVEGGTLKLGGRDLPDWAPRVTLEDAAALYQAYAKAGPEGRVGFSLDPEVNDFEALASGLFAALLMTSDLERTGVTRQEWLSAWIHVGLFENLLPLHHIMQTLRNRTTEEARNLYDEIAGLLGRYACQCARYDGDIKGTQVGMTLFYCDLLMKLWLWDFEAAAPRQQLGILPVLEFPISSLYWKEIWEFPEGRRWLGLNWSQVATSKTGILFSPVVSRIFAAVDDPYHPGKEAPPSKVPERMRATNRWWQAHWPQIMAYEPEYFRLNALLKLSALIMWLQDTGQANALRFLEATLVGRAEQFDKWLEVNEDRLTFKAWLPFTGRSAKGTECVSLLCSATRPAFGSSGAFLRGGVSLTERADLKKAWRPADYFSAMQKISREGGGRLDDLGSGTTYRFTSPNRVAVTPSPDARFRAPKLDLRLQGLAALWTRPSPDNWVYSCTWSCMDGQSLDEAVSFRRTAAGITIDVAGSAVTVQQLTRGLTKVPWDTVQAIYYDPKLGDLVIKVRVADGTFWLKTARPQVGNVDPTASVDPVEAASYNVGVQLLPKEPSEVGTLPNVLQKVRTRVEELKKAPAACGIVDLESHYLVITDLPSASLFMFPKDSQLAKALTGKVQWPASLGDKLWQVLLEPFFRHVFSTLPETVGFRFTDSEGEVKVILETQTGALWPVLLFPEDMKRTLLDGRKIDVRLPPQGMQLVPETGLIVVGSTHA